jgi:hypothetical protein
VGAFGQVRCASLVQKLTPQCGRVSVIVQRDLRCYEFTPHSAEPIYVHTYRNICMQEDGLLRI